ncbi:fasciclin-2 isoform X3 [Culex quinquefasciatus]|uniref:fasciclin-2 isoform X3 n=1 Tax=Culex quinquefasciatus TaxID=7176 RepID=UPI0018E2AD92|nr:fasciclin-2 isoform X3 [Culex quinquefasciatus]XP_039441437.1 fasciclin-2 isoform X4 [Culex pipiens pallens]
MTARLNSLSIAILCWITVLGLVRCQKVPSLQILPAASVQRKPVGASLLLTCRPDVPDSALISDLRWSDNRNMTIPPKAAGQSSPPIYTESIASGQALALIFNSLQESMAGVYYCAASYSVTEQLGASVSVETYVAITWKDAPEDQRPILGDDYIVRCEVTANPPATVDWLRNGDPIKSSGRYVIENRGLLIRNVSESDDGLYTCRAAVISTGELAKRVIRVEVQIKPEVQKLPLVLDAVEGQSFSYLCNATGKPVPEFQWIKKSTQQNVVDIDRFSVNALTGQLDISRVEQDDHDTYSCVAKNAAGISESTTKLNVLIRPKILEFMNITVPEDSDAVLACRAFGRPPPEITFRRFGTTEEYSVGLQVSDDRIVLDLDTNAERGETIGSLRIHKVDKTDDGLYDCIARNPGDVAYKVGHITVEYKPNFDNMKSLPPVYTWEQRPANLSCLAQAIPNATIEWRWNDRRVLDLYDINMKVENVGARSDLIIIPREPRYYTSYKCVATNRLGSEEHVMELREARIPDAVGQARPRSVSATSMTFDIIPPAIERGLPITAVSVQYKEEFNPDWNTALNRTWSPDSPYIVEGLRPQTSYSFRFAVRNIVGLGQWAAYVVHSTPKRSEPETPKTLHTPIQEEDEEDDAIVTSPYADHFELRWNVPVDNGEPINFYRVKFCPGSKINGVWTELEGACIEEDIQISTSYEMRDLQADTYYRIELMAHNAIGFSKPAHLLLKTARGIDVVLRVDDRALSSAAVIGIVVGCVLLLLLVIDILCCLIGNLGLLAMMCRRTKRSPSDLMGDEEKLGSLYGWRFPLPYCSGSLIKERPPSPLPLPPPIVKLGVTTPMEDEKQPLNNGPDGDVLKSSSVEFDGRGVQIRSGEIIGKNSAV